ncbi:hypothetical protein WJX74_007562 [Apatococcus lobatus]|uniref:Uncharacterized protein n=1 Tax=Apatococcus lobatus TaxID=904363 RepID=A0AAW1QJR8_9CHLO
MQPWHKLSAASRWAFVWHTNPWCLFQTRRMQSKFLRHFWHGRPRLPLHLSYGITLLQEHLERAGTSLQQQQPEAELRAAERAHAACCQPH